MRSGTYRPELMSLLVIVGIVVGTLEGFHLGGIEPTGLVGVVLSIGLISIGLLRVIPIAEGVFILEAVSVSLLAPIVIEPTLRFELLGVAIAAAFVASVGLNRLVERTEPSPVR